MFLCNASVKLCDSFFTMKDTNGLGVGCCPQPTRTLHGLYTDGTRTGHGRDTDGTRTGHGQQIGRIGRIGDVGISPERYIISVHRPLSIVHRPLSIQQSILVHSVHRVHSCPCPSSIKNLSGKRRKNRGKSRGKSRQSLFFIHLTNTTCRFIVCK